MNNYFERLFDRFASAFFFAVFATFIALMAMLFGCGTENPICGDTLCVDGSVFLKSELPVGAEYDSVNVDESVILATLVGTPVPVEPQPIEVNPTQPTQVTLEGASQTTMGEIVTNTILGGNRYEGTVVEIVAIADLVDDENEWITLETDNLDVTFYVNAYGSPIEGTFKKPFVAGKSYTLQLYIQEQEPHKTLGNAVWSYPVDDIIDTTISNIVSDTLAGNKQFEGKVVNITATVNYVAVSNKSITLETGDTSIRFWVKPFGDIVAGTFQKPFVKGDSYNLQLYIREQKSDTFNTIRSYLVDM